MNFRVNKWKHNSRGELTINYHAYNDDKLKIYAVKTMAKIYWREYILNAEIIFQSTQKGIIM